MKKILAVALVAAAALVANGAAAGWSITESAQKVQEKADSATKKIEEAKARQLQKEADRKAKQEAKEAARKEKIEAKKAVLQKKIEAKKAELNNARSESDVQTAEQKKAIEDAKNSLNNLSKALKAE